MPKRTKVRKLRWVEELPDRPSVIRTGKIRKQSIKAGLGYEKKLAQYLAAYYGEELVRHGLWLRYEDAKGIGYAQPDVVIDLEDMMLIVEAKLTFTPRKAYQQLGGIYKPLMSCLYPLKTMRCIQVCKNLGSGAKAATLLTSLDQATAEDVHWKFATFQWRPN